MEILVFYKLMIFITIIYFLMEYNTFREWEMLRKQLNNMHWKKGVKE